MITKILPCRINSVNNNRTSNQKCSKPAFGLSLGDGLGRIKVGESLDIEKPVEILLNNLRNLRLSKTNLSGKNIFKIEYKTSSGDGLVKVPESSNTYDELIKKLSKAAEDNYYN